jgi:hypothetical protein
MYSITYSGFGAASAQTLANAKAVWPKCWSVEAQECNTNRDSLYPGCAAMWKLWDEDPAAFKAIQDESPFCSESDAQVSLLHGAVINPSLKGGAF